MKPKVGDQVWNRIFHNQAAEVYKAQAHEDFFKVVVNRKAKYFYGETAHMDYQRYVYDLTTPTLVGNVCRSW